MFAGQSSMRKAAIIFLLMLGVLLVVGTFQIDVLKTSYLQVDLDFLGSTASRKISSAGSLLMLPGVRKASPHRARS
jgi:hypothetical protein